MKRAKGKRGMAGGQKRRRGPAIWTIVLIDQEPIRRKTADNCQREMKRLEKARADWKRFEQEDRPAFERWRAITFGPLLSALREVCGKIQEKEALIDEVEGEMAMRGWRDYGMAYQRLRIEKEQARARAERAAQRASGHREDEGDDGERSEFRNGGESAGEENPFADLEDEMMFDDFARVVMGIDPDRLSDAAYERMFAEFKKKVLGQQEHWEREQEALPNRESAAAEERGGPSRLKELYRILVRRLHPDMRADSDPDVSALWHDVQEAYATGNVERLEMLLAFTDMQAESVGEQTTVSQMLAVLKEIRSSLHALLRTLSGAKREMAWDFARNTNRAPLEGKLRKQLERDIAAREQHLKELESFIGSWTIPKRSRPRRQSRAQDEFTF